MRPSGPSSAPRRHRTGQVFGLETLEARVVLSGGIHSHAEAVTGTIGGQVTMPTDGTGLGHVQVQLINAAGREVVHTFTDAAGNYSLKVRQAGAYIVRELTPQGMAQVYPSFGSFKPVGAYAPGKGGSSWNYSSTNTDPAAGAVGPVAWGAIAPAGDLPFESPTIMHGPTVNLDQVLSINYQSAVPSDIIDNGKQIQVQYNTPSAADSITAGGETFDLAQFHYHEPAENLINKYQYTMEEHFVNVSASGAEAVVAVFLKLGPHNNALDPILNAAYSKLQKSGTSTKITTPIDFSGLLPTNHQGWYYQGSLTTPPLSQPVYWFVLKTPITLDLGQLGKYTSVAGSVGFLPNARNPQPLLGRPLNQINNQVNFTGGTVANVNFTLATA
jgi:carbonic anhydrase